MLTTTTFGESALGKRRAVETARSPEGKPLSPNR